MATVVMMKHKELGLTKEGFIGFSWTTLFFGVLPALFRSDFVTFAAGFGILIIIYFAMAALTFGVAFFFFWWVPTLAWAFMYNRYYTRKLIEKGYVFSDTPFKNAQAAAATGVTAGGNFESDLLQQNGLPTKTATIEDERERAYRTRVEEEERENQRVREEDRRRTEEQERQRQPPGLAEQLAKLQKLNSDGVLSDDEYQDLKRKLIAKELGDAPQARSTEEVRPLARVSDAPVTNQTETKTHEVPNPIIPNVNPNSNSFSKESFSTQNSMATNRKYLFGGGALVIVLIAILSGWHFGWFGPVSSHPSATQTLVPATEAERPHVQATAAPDNSSFAPSFDCSKASNGQERLICNDRDLAKLDVDLHQAYTKAREAAPDKAALLATQRDWIQHSVRACSDKNCLVTTYVSRIQELTMPTTKATETGSYYFITGLDPKGDNWLALKAAPDITSTRLKQLSPDVLLTTDGQRVGEWLHVKTIDGDDGWVASKYTACCRKAPSLPR